MLSIRSTADMERALASPMDPRLRCLLTERRDQLLQAVDDLGDIVHIIVAQPGDTLPELEAEAGVPLTTNLVGGVRYGEPDFEPSFEFIKRHGRWLEAVLILSDDGYGLSLWVPDCISVDASLRLMLVAHA